MLTTPGSAARARAISVLAAAGLLMTAAATPAAADEPPFPAPPQPVTSGRLTVDQAVAQARTSGKPVEATGAASSTDIVTANPDGTVTVSRSALPQRKRVGETWQPLDATLVRNSDGTWSSAVGYGQVRLSGGGSGPLATIGDSGLSMSLTAPMPLPEPTVSGPTATYANVLPDVDLQVTADARGAFSEVFVVHTPEAAANPALANLSMGTKTTGITLSTDNAGNITGTDRSRQVVLTAPAPLMWDSTTAAPSATGKAAAAGQRGGSHATSTSAGPAPTARTARIRTALTRGKIRLTPDKTLLTGPKTVYPVFIDPTFTWSSSGSDNDGWTTVAKQYPSTNYWKKTPDPYGRMQVGNAGSILSRTFINFPISTSVLAGATINTATLKITETYAYSCNARRVDLYAPATTLTASNATWNYWSGQSLGSVVSHQTVAYGYNSSCPANGVAFDVKSTIQANVSAGKKLQTFALRANDETDTFSWKEFLETSPTLAITYNHKPNKPSGLTTSPATSCTTLITIGDGNVTLYAPVSDRNGGVLGVRFELWKTSAPGTILATSDPNLLTYGSGSTAVRKVGVDTLRAAAGGAITQFSWRAQATDFNQTSDWSSTCSFKFDPTRTGAPDLPTPAEGSTQIGKSFPITISPPTTGTTPSGYLYQLNAGPPSTLPATNGSLTINITPTRFTNSLTVTSLSPGGNIGDNAVVTFNSTPAAYAADGDFTGDGNADLVTAGAKNGLAPGLWLGAGAGISGVNRIGTNIGARGNGVFLTGRPTDFNGAQILPGRFAGQGLQDVLAYYPTGTHAGEAVILRGNGDGSTIQAQLDGTYTGINAGTFIDNQGLNPVQLVNAGHGRGLAYPDLIGIGGDANGYYLNYYPNFDGIGGYGQVDTLAAQATPTGGYDWNTWTITSAQTPTGTSLFLWQATTGKLYLWNNLSYDNDGTYTLHYTQHLLNSSWNTGKSLTLQGGDINGDGTGDLWTIDASAKVTPWLVTGLTTDVGVITASTNRTLITADHAWPFNNADGGPVSGSNVATDDISTLPATGAGNAAWNSGDVFSPNVTLDGTNSTLTTAGPAVATNADYTLNVWVKPTATGGTVISQDGVNTAGFRLWAEASDASWRVGMPRTDATTATWDTAAAAAGSVQIGVWTRLTISYQSTSGRLGLYVNDVNVATAVHPNGWNATGPLRIGAHKNGTTSYTGYLQGQISETLAWKSNVSPAQPIPAGPQRDFNSDGYPDVMARYSPNKNIFLYKGNGAMFNPSYTTIGSAWSGFDIIFSPGDFDGDGTTDVIARYTPTKELYLYRGTGRGNFQTGYTVITSSMAAFDTIFSPGDFDSDGDADIIARNSTTKELYLYQGTGDGRVQSGYTVISSSFAAFDKIFSPGDFDGDGHPDIIARINTTKDLYLYRGSGSGRILSGYTTIGYNWGSFNHILSVGDFNMDGNTDVIGRYSPTGDLYLYQGNGTGRFKPSYTIIGSNWSAFDLIF
ncbi:FG-GAP-like repeat-containing protein [Micromonospora aurantiaca]|uniref:FG-GAP-like repeat-containing protein n=1 Tax=Micromonospora aurantiaca (nom. illeg.) TaxID=47850 RepID=UPI0011CE3DE5|nr:FG-GAP-like repeat-containing protein [Micromonospora aurantiaca]